MNNFIQEYFLDPVLTHTGYNIVNTLTYAIIALVVVYILFKILKKSKIEIDTEFILGVLSFVLLGSTVRVVTDSIDTGVFYGATFLHQMIVDSQIYNYSFITASPGIYLVIASLFLISLFLTNRFGKREWLKFVGLGLWIPHFLILIPFMKYAIYAIPILLLSIIPASILYYYFKDWRYGAIVAAHGLDGGATFFMIDFFGKITGISYWEQHVFSRVVGGLFGTYFTFYALKVAIAVVAAYLLMKEKMEETERNYILLLIMIIGFAPGIRDVLRMVIGG